MNKNVPEILMKVLLKSIDAVKRFAIIALVFIMKYLKTFVSLVKDYWQSGKVQRVGTRAKDFIKKVSAQVYLFFKNFKWTLENSFSVLFVFFVIIVLVMVLISYNTNYRKSEFSSEKRFLISEGKSFNLIAEELERDSVIQNAFYFKLAAKLQGKDNKIISRTYILKNNLNNLELLNLLTNPDTIFAQRITIPEGSRIKQISKYAAAKFDTNLDSFMLAAANSHLAGQLGLETKIRNLEGFLFPDTYMIEIGAKEKEIVEVMFYEFIKKVHRKYDFKSDPEYLLKIITLASIIQAETNLPEEMPIIAGVYMNRLNKKMKLEADPTVQYVIPDGPKQRLMNEDLKFDSPYNTYKYYGLPPGPINNPGIKAIEAALNPAEHKYLFFVATGNGGHKFSETYAEHLKAVQEYRKNVKQK